MTPTLTVAEYMTPSPHTVGRAQPLRTARHMMQKLRVRHLPVLDGGKLIGMLSDRELGAAESLPGADLLKVEEAMSPTTYMVTPEAPLDAVAREMAELKVGSAVVMHGPTVLGVFTAVDGLRALADALSGSGPAGHHG